MGRGPASVFWVGGGPSPEHGPCRRVGRSPETPAKQRRQRVGGAGRCRLAGGRGHPAPAQALSPRTRGLGIPSRRKMRIMLLFYNSV